MTSLLTNIELNPDFPHKDIGDASADLLSLMLQNNSIMTSAHNVAELYYRRSHHTIGLLAHRLSREDVTAGMELGAMTFEAVSAMVRPQPPSVSQKVEFQVYRSHLPHGGVLPTIDLLEQAKEALKHDCPNLSYVVAEVASQHSPRLAAPALLAAGISRSIELEASPAA